MFRKIGLFICAVVLVACFVSCFTAQAGTPPLVVQRGGTGIDSIPAGYSLWGSEINAIIGTSSMSMDMDTGDVTIGSITLNAVAEGDLIVLGRLGVNTNSPTTELYVDGRITAVGEIEYRGDVNSYLVNETYPLMYASKDGGVYPFSVYGNLIIQARTSAGDRDIIFAGRIEGADNREIMVLKNTGNVGIGTTSPEVELDIVGDIRFGNTSTTTCSALIDGTILYNKNDKHFYGCDGTNWLKLNN